MGAFRITVITSIGAFIVGVACAAAGLALDAKLVNSGPAFISGRPHTSGAGFPLFDIGRASGDPDAPVGYSRLGIAKINGKRVAVYAFQNGAKLGDSAGRGRGSADVFDSAGHLIRRFVYRENLNSPPRIIEFVFPPGGAAKDNDLF